MDLLCGSSDRILLTMSLSASLDNVSVRIVQKTSLVVGRIDNNASAWVSSSKFKFCEASLVSAQLNVLTCVVARLLHPHE